MTKRYESKNKIHMTGTMTNPMIGVLGLWKEKLLLRAWRQEYYFHTESSDSSLLTSEGEEVKCVSKENLKSKLDLDLIFCLK